jgi:hypothetical protein
MMIKAKYSLSLDNRKTSSIMGLTCWHKVTRAMVQVSYGIRAWGQENTNLSLDNRKTEVLRVYSGCLSMYVMNTRR